MTHKLIFGFVFFIAQSCAMSNATSIKDELKNNLKSHAAKEKSTLIKKENDALKNSEEAIAFKDSLAIKKETITTKAKPDHRSWSALLTRFVADNGEVDYKAFLTSNDTLNSYLKHLAENSPQKTWTKNEKLAYYINLYNAATVKLIIDNYPLKSIRNLKNPWGKDWIKIGEGVLSLGDIEHKILRKMNEPRIHFAINCASYSCPKLFNKAFEAQKIEAQLEQVTKDFINDDTKNVLSKNKVQLSHIFKWYKKDFTEKERLLNYIKKYANKELSESASISYLKYDWTLNDAK